MKLIAGLGNPGRAYARNRHNVGFQCVDFFARAHGLEFARRQAKAVIALGEVSGEKLIVAKPQTFMNLSGESVGPVLRWYKLTPSDLIVIHDDLDLPLGRIRIRMGGSSGGHNGVQSIIGHLRTGDFPRIRVGIGRPFGGGDDVISFVLSDFTRDEQIAIDAAKERVGEAIEVIIGEGLVAAMNRFNP